MGCQPFPWGRAVFGHGTDNAWDEARQLVLGALHLPWEIADSYLDCNLEEEEISHVQRLLHRRIHERVPTAYLLKEAWFCGMSFIVDERVLIPRSPIGELIENRFEPWLAQPPARILDLCTGSGCIGIACAYEFQDAEVVLGTCPSKPWKWPTRTSSAMASTSACTPCRVMVSTVCRASALT